MFRDVLLSCPTADHEIRNDVATVDSLAVGTPTRKRDASARTKETKKRDGKRKGFFQERVKDATLAIEIRLDEKRFKEDRKTRIA